MQNEASIFAFWFILKEFRSLIVVVFFLI
jgi:hypothetical protein